MPKILIVLILCSISINDFAQNIDPKTDRRPDSIGYYMVNETTMANSEQGAKFVRLLIKTDSNMFRVNDYYMDGTQKLVAKTSLDNMNFITGTQGEYSEYSQNGKIRRVKHYKNGELYGELTNYYPNGGIYSVQIIKNDNVTLVECRDSIGNVLCRAKNGNWLVYDESFRLIAEGPVSNGKQEGIWKGTYSTGFKSSGIYKEGILQSGNLFEKKYNLINDYDTKPLFKGGDLEFVSYVSKSIVYPYSAVQNHIRGRVILSFFVEVDGSIDEIKVIKGLGHGCDEEAIRVLKKAPRWKPATKFGRPVRAQISVPLIFYTD